MRRMMSLFVFLTLAMAVGVPSASAVPILRLSDGVTTVSVTDGSGDINPVTGAVTYIGSVGSFVVNVSTGLTKPLLGTASLPSLDLSSINVTGGSGGTLTIAFTETDFAPLAPALTNYVSEIGGVIATGGSLTYDSYLDLSNTAFGTGTALGSQNFTDGAFSGLFTMPDLLVGSPYSLTQIVTLSHLGSWQGSSFNATLTSAPEPASLALFGTGLVGLAALVRRRIRKPAR